MSASSDIDDIALPTGWRFSSYARGIVIVADGIGGVTVDIDGRCFRGGWSVTCRPNSVKKYTGRGWRKALFADAIKWLQRVGTERAK